MSDCFQLVSHHLTNLPTFFPPLPLPCAARTPTGMDSHLERSYWAVVRGPNNKTLLLKVHLSRQLAPGDAYFVACVTPLSYEEGLDTRLRVTGLK